MPRAERERRYIAEYMAQTYPRGNYQLNVPLGPIPQELVQQLGATQAAQVFYPTRPRIDAVAWLPGAYILVEAKIREPKHAIGDLLVYRSLIPSTRDLPSYDGQAIVSRLVVPEILEWIRVSAEEHRLEVATYHPAWIADYWRSRQEYFTQSYRLARDSKQAMRKILGLE